MLSVCRRRESHFHIQPGTSLHLPTSPSSLDVPSPGDTSLSFPLRLSFLISTLFLLHLFVSGFNIAHLGQINCVVSSKLSALAVLSVSCPFSHHLSIQYLSQPSSLLSRHSCGIRPVSSRVYFSLTWRQWFASGDTNLPQSGQYRRSEGIQPCPSCCSKNLCKESGLGGLVIM